ncbi:DUF2804 family protein [Nitriliruptoraceae bacterium ZYF776]|nr:DUF2804 family protein [Profundirhabdus halotolerans]
MTDVAPPSEPLPGGRLVDPAGRLVRGRFAGEVTVDPVPAGPRGGRVRRWTYVAAGDADTTIGAAVVHLGAVGVAFAFARVDGRTATFEVKRPLARGARVGLVPVAGAALRTGRARLDLGGDGSLSVDVPTRAGRLRAEVAATGAVTPAVLCTGTAAGGWNVTQKAAGTPVAGRVALGDAEVTLGPDAGGWSDWTSGRQDRRTVWRWGAGAGTAADGRRVGCNVSTGMNGLAEGEDVVWWDGVPHPLAVTDLAAAGADAAGPWRLVVAGGHELRLTPAGVRAADERLLVVTSRYTQPFGTWRGDLPDPVSGEPVPVTLAGVAEDHLAVW